MTDYGQQVQRDCANDHSSKLEASEERDAAILERAKEIIVDMLAGNENLRGVYYEELIIERLMNDDGIAASMVELIDQAAHENLLGYLSNEEIGSRFRGLVMKAVEYQAEAEVDQRFKVDRIVQNVTTML